MPGFAVMSQGSLGGMALALALALAGAGAHAAAPDLCAVGRRQSPIDITLTRRQALPALQPLYRPAPLRVVNDGHTLRVRFANGSRLMRGTEPLALQQFHFHRSGGDRVHGEDFPLAMHWLHKGRDGRLVALVLLFRQGAENAALAALLPQLPAAAGPERALPGVTVDPAAWLPAQLGHYAYEGSLTAPPCTEGVLWLVLKTPLQASAAQLARLAALMPPNARPVQPLHGRVVAESL